MQGISKKLESGRPCGPNSGPKFQSRSAGKMPTDSPCCDILAGEHDGVAGDVGAGADDGGLRRTFSWSCAIVGVGKDAREGADDRVVADGDAAAIVEQGALVDGDAVADGEVVAVGQVDAVIDFARRCRCCAKMCRPSMQRKRSPSQ